MSDFDEILSDLLEKIINIQANTVETMTKNAEQVKRNAQILANLETQFQNGFRSEIKNHVSKIIAEARAEASEDRKQIKSFLEKVNKNLDKLNETLQSPRFWIYIIGSIIAAIAVIMAALAKFA